MSTILKALKRAEQDHPDLEKKNGSELIFNVRTTLSSKMQRQQKRSFIRSGQGLFFPGLAVVIGIAIFFLFFGNKAFQLQSPSREKASQSPDIASVTLKDQKPPVRSSLSESVVLTGVGQQKKTEPETKIALPGDGIIPEPAKDTARTIPETKHLENDEKPPPLKLMEKRPRPQKKISPPAALPPLSRPDIKKQAIADVVHIEPLKEGILKLQAISWSKDPEDRIVVINNNVVGEGEYVEGYTLVRIEKEQVILRHSGREYKLVFKYR